jgi:hypothetical protein
MSKTVIPSILKRKISGAPSWAWLLGLVPWVWVIPMNQRFWDDWMFVTPKDFDWHLRYWLTEGAKHYLDPFVMPAIYGVGLWFIHGLTLVCTCVMAWYFSKVFQKLCWFPQESLAWFGPLFMVIPVNHARLSGATFEYTASLALASAAWFLLLNHRGILAHLSAGLLLALAVGVPSTAVLFPFIFVSTVLVHSRTEAKRLAPREFFRYSYVLVIPLAYSVIYSRLLNSSAKYRVSLGGIKAFLLGFLGILALVVIVLAIVLLQTRRISQPIWAATLALLTCYVCLLPYLAVGINPLASFLPWRLGDEALNGLATRTLTSFVILSLIVLLLEWIQLARTNGGSQESHWLALVLFAGLCLVVITFGPRDWESRHWLVAWPLIVVVVLLLVTVVAPKSQQVLAQKVFLVALLATSLISSEYYVDSLKQKSLVGAVRRELLPLAANNQIMTDPLIVIVEGTPTSRNLDARARFYRSHEWWGIVTIGLASERINLWVLERDDLAQGDETGCAQPYSAVKLFPRVNTSKWEALAQGSVDVTLTPQVVDRVCVSTIRAGWPRDTFFQREEP